MNIPYIINLKEKRRNIYEKYHVHHNIAITIL